MRARVCGHAGRFGRSLTAALDACEDPILVRKFLGVYRVTAAKLKGSVESMRSLQSRCGAANHALGPFSLMVNTNPSEMHSRHVMALCGRPYGSDDRGWPDADRPSSEERYKLVAANPWACATFFENFTTAWTEVFYGWPRGARRQRDANCLFGQVGVAPQLPAFHSGSAVRIARSYRSILAGVSMP